MKLLDLFVDTLSPLVDRNRMGTVTYSPHADMAHVAQVLKGIESQYA